MGRAWARGSAIACTCALVLALAAVPSPAKAAPPASQKPLQASGAGPHSPKLRLGRANPARELGPERPHGRPKPVRPPSGRLRTVASPTWTALGPQPISSVDTYGAASGRVTSIAFDPTTAQTAYAGTAGGGVWKTTNGGISWSPMSDNEVSLGIGAVAVDPQNASVVYAGTGEANRCADCLSSSGILRSADGGATWTLLGQSPLSGHYIAAIAVDRTNSKHVLVASSAGLFESTDAAYWSANTSFASLSTLSQPRVDSLFQDASSPSVWWAAVGERCAADGFIARSTDDGGTWSIVRRMSSFAGMPLAARIALAGAPGGVLYALVAACAVGAWSLGQFAGILKSTDSGAHWALIRSAPGLIDPFSLGGGFYQGWYDDVVAVDPTNSSHAVFGGVTLLATRDGGSTFADVARPYSNGPVHPDAHALAFTGAPDTLYAGNDGGIWHSSDLGNNWTNLNSTLAITTFYGGAAADSTHFVGGAQDDGSVARYPGGPVAPAWSEEADGDGTLAQIVPGSSIYYAAQPGGVMIQGDYTTPGVFRLASPCDNNAATPACTDPSSFVTPFAIDPQSTTAATTIYLGTNRVWRSSTGGIPAGTAGWTPISPDLTTGLNIFTTPDTLSAIAVAPNGTVVTASWGGAIFESTNANSANPTWSEIDYLGGLPGFNGSQYIGRPWISSVAVGSDGSVYAALGDTSNVYLGRSSTFYPFWTSAGSPGNQLIDSIALDPGNPAALYAGTDAGAFECYSYCGNNFANWVGLGNGLPNSPIDQITVAADQKQIVAWTHGRGAWILPNPNAQTLSIGPSPLDFGRLYPNSTPVSLGVSVSAGFSVPYVNYQNVTITGPNAADFAIASNTCTGTTLYCSAYVRFTPSASGTRTATLTFYDDAVGSPQSVPLTAYVTPANVSFSTTVVNLGSTAVNTTSAPVALTLTSTGTGPLTFGTLSFFETYGQGVAIVGGSDHCSGQTLSPGASCSISFSMTPSYPGSVAGSLSVPDNAGGGTQYVSITGTSTGPWVGLPPTSFDFGGMNVGTASLARPMTRTNVGNQDLVITAVALSGANASNFTIASENCTAEPVHPGKSCEVMVTFTPDAIASRTATLTFTDNALNELTTALNGHGVNVSSIVTYQGTTQDYGTVAIGAFGAKEIFITNDGPDPLTLQGILITGTNAADFQIGYSSCNVTTLPFAQGCSFILDFRPNAIGTPSRSGTLTVYDSAGAHAVGVTGTATGPSMVFSAGTIDFGTATAGAPVSRPLTITNGGDAAFTVNQIGAGCCFNDYSVATDGCTGVSIAPGGSCSVMLNFDPWGSGDRSDFIRVYANTFAISATFSVTGTGIAPSPSSPSVVFPDTAVTYSSAPITMTVTNSGPAAWTVGTVTTRSPNFGIVGGTDQCSGTIVSSGGSCSLQVVFTPRTSASFLNAALTSSGNFHFGFGGLGGNAISPYATPAQWSVGFGSVETGTATVQSIPVTNTGNAILHVSGVSFASGASFSLSSQTCQSVAPHVQCLLNVAFAPTTLGNLTDKLTILDDEVTQPSISLSGYGVAPSACTGANLSSSPPAVGSAGTQVVFTAAAYGCPRPVFDFLLTPPGGTPVEMQSYLVGRSTWTWDTSGLPNGAYQIQVRARDFPSSAAQEAAAGTTFQIVSPACLSATVTSDHPGPQPPGAGVTFTAARPGCVDAATYQFWVVGNGVPWTIVQPYSTKATWTVDYSLLKGLGSYSIDVWVKEPGSTNQYDTFGLASFVVAGCTSATISSNVVNGTFAVSASGPACGSPEFEYWIFNTRFGWSIAAPWTSSKTFDRHAPGLNLAPGTNSLDVWVRQQGSSTNKAYYQTWALGTIAVPIPGGACSGATLAPSQASPEGVGASVGFTATPGTCPFPQYEYWLYPGAGGGWQVLRPYSATATYALDSSALHLKEGTYSVVAWVRQPGTPSTAFDDYALYAFTFGGDDSVELGSDFHSPQPLGRTVTFTATPVGPAAASSEYEFWGLLQGGSWVVLQDWSADPKMTLETLYAPYGPVAIVVWVRAAGTSPAGGYETYDLVSYALTG